MSIGFNHITALALGYVIDLIVGDPYWFPHPIRFIGWFISKAQANIRKRCKNDEALKRGGVVLLLSTMIISVGSLAIVMYGLSLLGERYYFIGQVFFSWLILSVRCLAYEGNMVKKALDESLEAGRNRVKYIVGRDTDNLTEEEVIKATVETVAENTTDGIISPMLYMLIGGVYLGIAFKAVSTLDSMVGYKNEKYLHIGCASAKFDDVLNYIPARLTGFLMVISALVLRFDYRNSFKILKRDHQNHKSPNCGWSESAVAGALNIQLGGTHNYFGKEVYKPTIGDENRKVEKDNIIKTNRMMVVTSIIAMIGILIILFILFILKTLG